MRLSFLLKEYFSQLNFDCEIEHISLDSRNLQLNSLFIALKGTKIDGRDYIPQAIANGAVAVLVNAHPGSEGVIWQDNIPVISIPNLNQQIGTIAARFYGYPANKMKMIGVTGTNGKTSCTHFLAQLYKALGYRCGIIGTLGSGFYGNLGEAGLTTPDAIKLQALLNDLHRQEATHVAMEVSSHSIDQGRINGINFDVGIFTNLTQDHLDYHGTMQEYARVKRSFFADMPVKLCIINGDCEYGQQFINELAYTKTIIAYGTKPHSFKHNVEYLQAANIDLTLEGIKATISSPWGEGELKLPLIGKFNLSNALAVIATLCVEGLPLATVLAKLNQLESVPGRMQVFKIKNQPLVVVDYAHTPDALEKVLQALKAHTQGKLYCVFGCGGDRDHTKRPLMGRIAAQLADYVLITNDNPRHEIPEAIAEQILQGLSPTERIQVILDRSKAIQNSIQWATPNDCVLVAGKGAERYQQIGDEKIPFDDAKIVLSCLTINHAE